MMPTSTGNAPTRYPAPFLTHGTPEWNPAQHLTVAPVPNPLPHGTLGDLDIATHVIGPDQFPLTVAVLPFAAHELTGIDPQSVRVFRWDDGAKTLRPVWNSGLNAAFKFVWAKITRPGTYVPIGLPRDRVLQELLRSLAHERRYADTESLESHQQLTRTALEPLLQAPERELQALRSLLTDVERHTSAERFSPGDFAHGHGGYVRAFHLPHGETLSKFKERLQALETPLGGLPEEALFFPPETLSGHMPPWDLSGGTREPWHFLNHSLLTTVELRNLPRLRPCWFVSPDWWMYHHDSDHSGDTSGCSDITSTSASRLYLLHSVALNGTVKTIPSVVDGKVYVGTSDASGSGGLLYKIDLLTGVIDGSVSVPQRMPAYSQGIGGSPAVVAGRVYFTCLPGQVRCVDAATLAPVWTTDLRLPDPAHNQPVNNPLADSWTGPLVVNGKVYVGCGQGESGAFGFVYCLDAATGNVVWLFCANRFTNGVENSPNVIPASAAGGTPLPAGFSTHADPPVRGISVWSSCAYDPGLNRVYVGTGNSTSGDNIPLPDAYYGSGVLALDADTGAFKGFYQPSAADNYRPDDTDVDVCGSPLLITRGGQRLVAIGSKGGVLALLDAATLTPVVTPRQVLPKDAVSGLPIGTVDPHGGPGENYSGIFGTPAVHGGLQRLFVGIGGYNGMIDTPTTPFLRALDWNTLDDAWTMSTDVVGPNQVKRYTVPRPPMYTTPNEPGLSSPAVVNDVVLVSTSKPGLYALDAATGLCLWSADGLQPGNLLGPAIYGNYVVIGCGGQLNIYTLTRWWRPPWPPIAVQLPPWWRILPPPPPPPPDGDGILQLREGGLGG